MLEQLRCGDHFLYSSAKRYRDVIRSILFSYVILDEAQHIKNRGTRNAKSVKMVQADHRLILSGTPIENSLDELWSLFDFLMPGFLSILRSLCRKIYPRLGRRTDKKSRISAEKSLPLHFAQDESRCARRSCRLFPKLSTTASSAMCSRISIAPMPNRHATSWSNWSKRDGFDRVQIHVLATLDPP